MATISHKELIDFLETVIRNGDDEHPNQVWAKALLAKLQPPLRKIDLSNLDPRVPVRVWFDGGAQEDLYIKPNLTVDHWDRHTLKTDRWVFNDLGTNPWPEGCVVEYESPSTRLTLMADARDLVWVKASIIASRYVGPAEGWTE